MYCKVVVKFLPLLSKGNENVIELVLSVEKLWERDETLAERGRGNKKSMEQCLYGIIERLLRFSWLLDGKK